jgi:hypothetical protein
MHLRENSESFQTCCCTEVIGVVLFTVVTRLTSYKGRSYTPPQELATAKEEIAKATSLARPVQATLVFFRVLPIVASLSMMSRCCAVVYSASFVELIQEILLLAYRIRDSTRPNSVYFRLLISSSNKAQLVTWLSKATKSMYELFTSETICQAVYDVFCSSLYVLLETVFAFDPQSPFIPIRSPEFSILVILWLWGSTDLELSSQGTRIGRFLFEYSRERSLGDGRCVSGFAEEAHRSVVRTLRYVLSETSPGNVVGLLPIIPTLMVAQHLPALLDAGVFTATCSIIITCSSARYRRNHRTWIEANSEYYEAIIDRLSRCLLAMLDTEVNALTCWYPDRVVFAIRSLVHLSAFNSLQQSTFTNITLLIQRMTVIARIYKPLSTLRAVRRAVEIDASTSSSSISRISANECTTGWSNFVDLLLVAADDRMAARRSTVRWSICEAPDVRELYIALSYLFLSLKLDGSVTQRWSFAASKSVPRARWSPIALRFADRGILEDTLHIA